MRSHRSGADGVVGIAEIFRDAFFRRGSIPTTPSAPLKEASRLLLDVASTPPDTRLLQKGRMKIEGLGVGGALMHGDSHRIGAYRRFLRFILNVSCRDSMFLRN
jgi:hypothetical protein